MTAQTADLEPKTLEILGSVKSVFASKGFDGASMQDLARAAGMSAGNFYRYFPSKDAIVEAIVAREIDRVRLEFETLIYAPRPLEAFSALVQSRFDETEDGSGQIWAEIEAAASRRPEFAGILVRMETEVMRYLVRLFTRVSGLSEADAARCFAPHARLIILLVKGMKVHTATCCLGRPDQELASLVVKTIERTVAEVAGTTRSEPATVKS